LIELSLAAPIDRDKGLLGSERRDVGMVSERDVRSVSSENETLRRVVRGDTSLVGKSTIDLIDDEHWGKRSET